MLTGQSSAWHRQRSWVKRLKVAVAIPAALTIAIGGSTLIGAVGATSASAETFGGGTTGDVALTNPVDPAGNAINLNQTVAQAANSGNCTILVPADPLTAQGLATPYRLSDGCTEANANESAFVEATILAPNGTLSNYDPLTITNGTTPLRQPLPATVPAGSTVVLHFGFNGNNLVLEGTGATQGNCIDAFGNSIIAQTAACNARNFYSAANAAIGRGTLKVPPLGTATDGKSCEDVRSFSLIDQDQQDNTLTQYLANGNGQTAQNTPANKAALAGATTLGNGSDDGLLGGFVDPALGCTPWQVTNPTAAAGKSTAQAENDLQARQFAANAGLGPQALLPVNDPQLLVGGKFSIGKVNVYRSETDDPLLSNFTNANQNAATYCQNMVNLAPPKLQLDMAKELNFTSPVPGIGNNLATALGNRLFMSFGNLNCQNFGLKNPVTIVAQTNGVATQVAYNLNLTHQVATVPGTQPAPPPNTGGFGGGAAGPGGFGGMGFGGRTAR